MTTTPTTPTMSEITPELLQDQWFLRLLHIRQQITNIERKVAASGELCLTAADFSTLKRVLEMAAYHTFDPTGTHYRLSKVGIAVRHLRKPKIYDTDIAERATRLYERWSSGDFTPGPIFDGDGEAEFSSDEEESDEDVGADVGGELMRGILVTRGQRGGRTYTLDPAYPRREAAVFGTNGCKVGDWWPFQICALRDGAHGSRMGGIHGRGDGAYSVVISGSYEDSDNDFGDVVYYSGSRGAAEPGVSNKEAVLTAASKSLMMSSKRGKPVRVLRSSKCNSKFAPRVGIRYDGLYDVITYSQEETAEGVRYWRFTLRRQQGQPEIDVARPTKEERKEYVRMMSSY